MPSTIFPYLKRSYIIFGIRRNEGQLNADQCTPLFPDKFLGCEDIHALHTDRGSFIYLACSRDLDIRPVWDFAQCGGLLVIALVPPCRPDE